MAEPYLCSGWYEIRPDDTYLSVSLRTKVSTANLVESNGLSYTSSHEPDTLPASGTLCVRYQCNLHVILTDDTCTAIANAYNISVAQLLSFNPSLEGRCRDIAKRVDQTLCISRPLRRHSGNPNPRQVIELVEQDSEYGLAPGTRNDCWLYKYWVTTEYSFSCWTLTELYGIMPAQLLDWNPSLDQNLPDAAERKYNYPCSTTPGLLYCMGLEPPGE